MASTATLLLALSTPMYVRGSEYRGVKTVWLGNSYFFEHSADPVNGAVLVASGAVATFLVGWMVRSGDATRRVWLALPLLIISSILVIPSTLDGLRLAKAVAETYHVGLIALTSGALLQVVVFCLIVSSIVRVSRTG
jgi:hypothetical protein